jgi:hypothetical protein
MTDATDTLARSLVRNLYYATEGRTHWWSLPHKMSGATWNGIQKATDRGWMLHHGNSVCLTDAGRELVERPAPQIGGPHRKGLSDQSNLLERFVGSGNLPDSNRQPNRVLS